VEESRQNPISLEAQCEKINGVAKGESVMREDKRCKRTALLHLTFLLRWFVEEIRLDGDNYGHVEKRTKPTKGKMMDPRRMSV
jgi:hypothetical protein